MPELRKMERRGKVRGGEVGGGGGWKGWGGVGV